MTVKNILKLVSALLNRKDLVKYFNTQSCDDYERIKEDVETLLTSYNIICDEVATMYLKLINSEEFVVEDGKLTYDKFRYNPITIISVKDLKNRDISCRILHTEIRVNATNVVVEYSYSPDKKGLDDECDFSKTQIKERVLAYGIATEFCLIKGMYEEASLWHDKYTDALKNALSNKKSQIVKGRVWW